MIRSNDCYRLLTNSCIILLTAATVVGCQPAAPADRSEQDLRARPTAWSERDTRPVETSALEESEHLRAQHERFPASAPLDEAKTQSDEAGGSRRAPPLHPLPPVHRPPPVHRRPEPTAPPPRDMYFRDYGVNPWQDAREDPESTFALDVDTGSYTLSRAYLLEGERPPIEAVRVEEFVNYFDQDYAAPDGDAFSIHLDGAPSPWGDRGEHLLRVGLQGRGVRDYQRRDAVLTFVVDVSGSMEEDGRLELVKDALTALLDELGPGDEIGIVAYSDEAWVVLPTTSAADRRTIRSALRELRPMYSTNAEAGLELGYLLAEEAYRPGGINRVVLCSDGVANVGATGPEGILGRIRPAVEKGITLSALGVGMGNYNDVLMEQLADNADGAYYYVDDLREAERVFVEDLTGTLQVIARDAKAQVEFDPQTVERYRLIGYENRDVADEDFRDDTIDAGEIGAGHTVTVLYALRLNERRYGRLATVRVRYEEPVEGNTRELSATIRARELEGSFWRASPSFRLSVAVAGFGEVLRDSYYARDISLERVLSVAEEAADDLDSQPEVAELLQLIERADRLALTGL